MRQARVMIECRFVYRSVNGRRKGAGHGPSGTPECPGRKRPKMNSSKRPLRSCGDSPPAVDPPQRDPPAGHEAEEQDQRRVLARQGALRRRPRMLGRGGPPGGGNLSIMETRGHTLVTILFIFP
jgi:hypothetical protein